MQRATPSDGEEKKGSRERFTKSDALDGREKRSKRKKKKKIEIRVSYFFADDWYVEPLARLNVVLTKRDIRIFAVSTSPPKRASTIYCATCSLCLCAFLTQSSAFYVFALALRSPHSFLHDISASCSGYSVRLLFFRWKEKNAYMVIRRRGSDNWK